MSYICYVHVVRRHTWITTWTATRIISFFSEVEVLMLGIVVGTVPITVLGMMVAAWLQFKKGPTLGI